MRIYEQMFNEIDKVVRPFINHIMDYYKSLNLNLDDKVLDISKYEEELYIGLNTDFILYDDWGYAKLVNLIGLVYDSNEDMIFCYFDDCEKDCSLEGLAPHELFEIIYDLETILESIEKGEEIYELDLENV